MTTTRNIEHMSAEHPARTNADIDKVSAEPSDAEVEAAARAHHIAIWGDDTDPEASVPRDELKAARAALTAARAVSGR